MNRAERIYRIHAMLKAKPWSLARMLEELETSRATLVRDIGYMKDFMGAPIEYERTRNQYSYRPSAQEFELPGFWLNESELYALLASERLLDAVQPGLLSPYVGPLRARVRKLLEHSGHSASSVSERILLQTMAARPAQPHRFGTIAGAVVEGQRIAIQYHGRTRDAVSSRNVHPQRLLRYRDNWYLVAHCDQAEALRIFSLDRVLHVTISQEPALTVDSKQLDRFLRASFGIFSGSAIAWAVLRFSPQASRWVADETWHSEQIGQWIGDRYELQVPYSDPRELMMDVLKYGPEVEVLSPPELREMVAERLRLALLQYSAASAEPK